MRMTRHLAIIAACLGYISATTTPAQTPSPDEMWKIIQQQSEEIKELRAKIGQSDEVLDQVIEKTESLESGDLAGSDVQLGGYGELHYNSLDGSNGSDDLDRIDFHRFVMFFGHDFSDSIRFFSEVELEHSLAGDGQPGEVELEQAYIEFDMDSGQTARAGLFLMPVGLLNETHEPDTFYGVERNSVEKYIIPTTWWEGGLSLSGEFGEGLNYDLAFTSGLDAADGDIRSGRQKVASATAESGAWTGRIRHNRPGFEAGLTLHRQNDLSQGAADDEVEGNLYEGHIAIERGNFTLRALYASWDVDGDAAEAVGRDELEGWYIEPSLKINEQLGVFARFSEWDRQAGNSDDTEVGQVDFGFNYWPHENVVLKADYQNQDGDSGEQDGLNLGVGFSF